MMHYVLKDKEVVEVDDLKEWAEWFEKDNRRVALTEIGVPTWKCWIGKLLRLKKWEPVRISTVFLGLDHSYTSTDQPVVFETMVFGGKLDQEMDRYCVWQEAEEGHEAMRQRVLESM